MSAKKRQFKLRPLAETDLEQIWLYTFKHWSREQADKYIRDLATTMEDLACDAKTGRICSVREGYYQYAVGSHIVFYRMPHDELDVTRILHQRMDVERHL